jgi:hypothetical protein
MWFHPPVVLLPSWISVTARIKPVAYIKYKARNSRGSQTFKREKPNLLFLLLGPEKFFPLLHVYPIAPGHPPLHGHELIIAPADQRFILSYNVVPNQAGQRAHEKEWKADPSQIPALQTCFLHQQRQDGKDGGIYRKISLGGSLAALGKMLCALDEELSCLTRSGGSTLSS